MKPAIRVMAGLLACLPGALPAQEFQLHGYLDLRLPMSNGDETSWLDGALGKARFGADDATRLRLGAAELSAAWQITPALLAVANLQANPETSPNLGLLDAYLRYRSVSTTPGRGSARLGAFFPPISLENESVGWTSRWTLSPSAINTWVSEELRNVGAEFRLERRGAHGKLEFGIAGFQHNDPAGELLATRGWALGDVTSPLSARLREPDVLSSVVFSPAPLHYRPFEENDGRIGWQADLDWHAPGGGRLLLLRYDNRGDPESFGMQDGRRVFSWKTRFWSFGALKPVGRLTLIGQLMDGDTAFEPVPGLYLDTKLHAGYLLAGWDCGDWRPAVRFDMFSLRQTPDFLPAPLSEHGNAWTVAQVT